MSFSEWKENKLKDPEIPYDALEPEYQRVRAQMQLQEAVMDSENVVPDLGDASAWDMESVTTTDAAGVRWTYENGLRVVSPQDVGWQCPRCGRIWSPQVQSCNCAQGYQPWQPWSTGDPWRGPYDPLYPIVIC